MHDQDTTTPAERQLCDARPLAQPLRGNTGAKRTDPLELDGATIAAHEAQASSLAAPEGRVLLDYLRCTLCDSPEIWADLLTWLGDATPRDAGWRGWYDQTWTVLDGGIVGRCSDPTKAEAQGILVDLPGKACACLGENLGAFLAWCLEVGQVARADWAIDDRRGHVTLERILEADAQDAIVTRWHSIRVIHERKKRGARVGWTVYLGSRRSRACLRIYDKAAQQGIEGHWVRVELETKNELADALAREYLDKGPGAVVAQLNRHVRFAKPEDSDTNRRRWEAARWWVVFLGSLKRGPALLCGEAVRATVENMAAWVEKQAGAALATILTADGGDLTRLLGILDRGRYRMRGKHKAALALWAKGQAERDAQDRERAKDAAGWARLNELIDGRQALAPQGA